MHIQTAVVLTVLLQDDRPHYMYELYQRVPWVDQPTLSSMIQRMLREGLLERAEAPEPVHGNVTKRRYFQLTDAGRVLARTTAFDRLQQLALTLTQLDVPALQL
jgi:DNA-binding PadR family transcriptional regulator